VELGSSVGFILELREPDYSKLFYFDQLLAYLIYYPIFKLLDIKILILVLDFQNSS